MSRHSASIAGRSHPDAPLLGAMSRQRQPQAGRTGCALTGLRADWLAPQHPRSQMAGAYSGQACSGGRSCMSAPLPDPAGRGAGLCVPEVCGGGGVGRRTEGAARALVRGPPGGGRVPVHGGLRRPLPCLTAESTMPPAGRIVGRRAPRRRRARARLAARLCAGAGGPRCPRGLGAAGGAACLHARGARPAAAAKRRAMRSAIGAARRAGWLLRASGQRPACPAWPQCCGPLSKDGEDDLCRLQPITPHGPRAREPAQAAGRGRLWAWVRRRGLRALRGQAAAHGRGCHARAGAGAGAGVACGSGADRMRASSGRPAGRWAGRRAPRTGPPAHAGGEQADAGTMQQGPTRWAWPARRRPHGRRWQAERSRVLSRGLWCAPGSSRRVALEVPVAWHRRAVAQPARPLQAYTYVFWSQRTVCMCCALRAIRPTLFISATGTVSLGWAGTGWSWVGFM